MAHLKLLLIFSSLGGFLLSLTIYHKKHRHEKLACPIGGKCASVMASEYARFFGIPLELIGIFYYGIIFVSYTTLFLFGNGDVPLFSFLLFGFTISALLFSVYLTFIQAFTLKQWCTLCLTSAGLCTMIFASALITSEQSFMALLVEYQPLVGAFYLLALAVGLGTATVTDIFFLKYLRDYRISQSEYDVLKTLSQIMWTALSVIVVAGAGLALSSRVVGSIPPSFMAGWTALAVIVVNAAVLNLIVAPKLLHISFHEKHDHEPGELRIIQKLAFELGAVSLVSWYFVFIITVAVPIPSSLQTLFIAYGAIILAGVAVGRGVEYQVQRRVKVHRI